MKVLGVLSGTSMDAIDLAVADFQADGEVLRLRPIGHAERPWPADLRSDLLGALPPATSNVATWCRLETEAGKAFGAAARWATEEFGPVDLISSHGQTLYHWVEGGRALGSLQIGNPAWIHAATGVPVVSDLRSADIAAGGQGAPLASTLDTLWLGDVPSAALNLGGIANVTVVGPGRVPTSADTGPANCLLDAAAQRWHGLPSDIDGALARSGRVDDAALTTLLTDPYYALDWPKSTGREYFHAHYVEQLLGDRTPRGGDLFATLTELTAVTVADAITAAGGVERVVASGGGLRNPALVDRLRAHLRVPLVSSTEMGLPSDAKEAYLFALLGYLSVNGLPGTVAGATGARHPAVLGSLTPPVGRLVHACRPVRRVEINGQEDH
ncbi:anhydro-N-acetylmuramic acid kinase [Brooklawnia cerclae]|uniref:Anhydro-N-acetylmuramic acid kinase n=1 Tax=Brooklawnia cerclae TaxID=349934 RepID=A0ABX0SJ33_9ACTN|nr:anhydro-N-acetylmuramic acid kinase [Brooklawnia cerclae]